MGVNKYTDPSVQNVSVEKVILHSGWDNVTNFNDISLIKLHSNSSIKFKMDSSGHYIVNCLALPDTNEDPSGSATLCGWGETVYKSEKPSVWLQTLDMPIVPTPNCTAIYKDYLGKYVKESQVRVTKKHVCAGGVGDQDACRVS